MAAHLGIEIIVDPTMPAGLDGLLYIGQAHRLIRVRGSMPVTRQRFSVAHEIGHYLLHRGAGQVQMFLAGADSPMTALQEEEANLFSASALMPAPDLLLEVNERPDFRHLCQHFWVSRMAMNVRLRMLGVSYAVSGVPQTRPGD